MTNQDAQGAAGGEIQELRAAIVENRFWFITLGILLVLLGIAAIGFPFVTTIAAKIVVGWLFLIGGIAEIIHAFSSKNWKGFLANLLIGLLYVVVGGWLAFFPLAGIIGLTLLLAISFVIEGVLKFGMGVQIRPTDGWGWIVFSGIVAIVVGVLLITGLPSTAVWAIGLLVGVNLLMSGVSFLMVAIAAGKK